MQFRGLVSQEEGKIKIAILTELKVFVVQISILSSILVAFSFYFKMLQSKLDCKLLQSELYSLKIKMK